MLRVRPLETGFLHVVCGAVDSFPRETGGNYLKKTKHLKLLGMVLKATKRRKHLFEKIYRNVSEWQVPMVFELRGNLHSPPPAPDWESTPGGCSQAHRAPCPPTLVIGLSSWEQGTAISLTLPPCYPCPR